MACHPFTGGMQFARHLRPLSFACDMMPQLLLHFVLSPIVIR
jgi:hypothetical protein